MNNYIETLCQQTSSFGYDAYSNLSLVEKAKIKSGVLQPKTTAGTRWHYAKESAVKLGRVPVGQPMSGKIISAFDKAGSAPWMQYVHPPTSNKSVWYQGAIVFQVLAIFYGKPTLRARAKSLIAAGDQTKLSTRPLDIQNAAKNVYRKLAKFSEKEGLSSSDKQTKSVLNHVRRYAKASEIEFGKRISEQSTSSISVASLLDTRTDQQKQSASTEKIITQMKDITVNKMPFKNKAEGNKFREWVNAKYPRYARRWDLSLSGSHTNSFIQKAWNKYGKEYLAEPKPVAVAPKPAEVVKTSFTSNEPPALSEENPFGDVEVKQGMLELLEQDPEEFLKQYWYVPAGGFASIVGLALLVRVIRS